MKWTWNDFVKYTGRTPEQDDLDRCNCEQAGELGHHSCGICEHNKPVFECSICFTKDRNDVKRIS